MEMRIVRENIPVEQLAGQRQMQTVVEGELTLPGGLREEARVLQAGGMVVIDSCEAAHDKVNVNGKVIFHVLYTQGDPAKINAMEASAEFTQTVEVSGTEPKMLVTCRGTVEHVEAACYSGRMNLKAIVMLGVRVLSAAPVSVVTGLGQEPGLEIKSQTLTLARTVAQGMGEAQLREEFDLPQALEITDTLYATAQVSVSDVSGGEGRANVFGMIQLEVYHTSAMPSRPLVMTRHTLPFEHAVELTGEGAEQLYGDAVVRDVAVLSQEAGDGSRILRAEIVLGLSAWGDVQEQVTVLQDAYTTQSEGIELTSQPVICRVGDSRGQTAESGKAMLMLPEDSPAARTMLCGFATPIMTGREQVGGRLTVEGVLEVTLLYMTDDSPAPVTVSQEEPFRVTFAATPGPEDFLLLEAGDVDVSAITSDRVEMKYILRLTVDGITCSPVAWISEVQPCQRPEGKRGITLCFARPGDSVWELAKRYRISARQLTALNKELEQKEPVPGQAVVVYKRISGE